MGIRVILCFALVFPSLAFGGIRRVKTDQKVVALTFDDGPNPPHTEKLLEVLAAKKVKATFFLIGQQIDANPETTRKILKAGHEVGGHSCDWETLAFKKREQVEGRLNQMKMSFVNIGITNLVLFRPPGGFLSPGQGKILKAHGLRHISADVVVGDWKKLDVETICARVLKKVRPGSIVALHDGGGDRSATVAAVPQIIDALRKRGYSFVTVGELLGLK
jgi:peptidoglycan/xylan/chitin deacetylase (PgdA/CDA1 family)